jgi:hypothetical protein
MNPAYLTEDKTLDELKRLSDTDFENELKANRDMITHAKRMIDVGKFSLKLHVDRHTERIQYQRVLDVAISQRTPTLL